MLSFHIEVQILPVAYCKSGFENLLTNVVYFNIQEKNGGHRCQFHLEFSGEFCG